jgi:hypothetical protein
MDDPAPELEYKPDPTLGEHGHPLHLWLAKEAMRQGEMKIAQMSAVFDGFRAQATSLLGWSTTLGSAVTFAAITNNRPLVAWVGGITTMAEAALCIATIWPVDKWAAGTYMPEKVMATTQDCELQERRALARSLDQMIISNRKLIDRRFKRLRWAWVGMPAIPLVAAVALLFTAQRH